MNSLLGMRSFALAVIMLALSSCHEKQDQKASDPDRGQELPKLEEASDLNPSNAALSKESFFALGLDQTSFQKDLKSLVKLYNTGLDGQSGARAFSPDFDGYFRVNLDRSWKSKNGEATTSIAQSRWVYMNASAHQEFKEQAESRAYLDATRKGVRTLVQKFKDTNFGGYYYQVQADGKVTNAEKQDFSNCQPLLAFASAHKSEDEPWLLDEGLQQVKLILAKFSDPRVPGGIIPGLSREFGRSGTARFRNSECITHFFEGMLALYERAPPKDQDWLAKEIKKLGDFIAWTAVRPLEASDKHRYFSFFFDEAWKPSQITLQTNNLYAGSGWVSVGHTFEMAFLLSRAVEMGFEPKWLSVAEDLLRFGMDFGMNPSRGGVLFLVDYTGQVIGPERNPMWQKLDWWPQCEAARALLHFAVVRGDRRALSLYKKQERFMRLVFMDPSLGGWFGQVADKGDGLYPALKQDKGDIWQDAYHQTMFYVEGLRLSRAYP